MFVKAAASSLIALSTTKLSLSFYTTLYMTVFLLSYTPALRPAKHLDSVPINWFSSSSFCTNKSCVSEFSPMLWAVAPRTYARRRTYSPNILGSSIMALASTGNLFWLSSNFSPNNCILTLNPLQWADTSGKLSACIVSTWSSTSNLALF